MARTFRQISKTMWTARGSDGSETVIRKITGGFNVDMATPLKTGGFTHSDSDVKTFSQAQKKADSFLNKQEKSSQSKTITAVKPAQPVKTQSAPVGGGGSTRGAGGTSTSGT